MAQNNPNAKRFSIDYFEGVNTLVSNNIAKKQEFSHAENVRSTMIGTMEKRGGTTVVGNALTNVGNYGLFFFPNSGASNKFLYRVTEPTAAAGSTIYYLNSSNAWTALTGAGAAITNGDMDVTMAEKDLYLVNYNAPNRYILGSDGTTVITSATTTGNLYNSPNASNIAYYKGRLYLADYVYSSIRYPATVLRSSYACGIIALIDGDPISPYTTCNVTDTKYIYTQSPGNTLDVYRGNTKIAVLTVTAITNYSITMSTAFEGGQTELRSADELWAPGTYAGAKQFRWVNNGSVSGQSAKEYDTFKLSGGDESSIKLLEPIGNVLMIANNNSMAIWNDYVLQSYDYGIGCVSRKGKVKLLGALYFPHYSGIYATTGEAPKLISSKIERVFNGATRAGKEATCAGKKGRSVFFSIGNVTLYRPDGSTDKTLSNVVIEYAVTQEDWYVHTNIATTAFETFVDTLDTDRLVYASTASGTNVMEFLTGETDNGTEIPLIADTTDFNIPGNFERSFHPLEVCLDVERGAGIKVFVSLDNGPFYELEGEAVKGANILKVTSPYEADGTKPPRCRGIRVSLRHSEKQLIKVARLAITYIPTTDESTNMLNNDPA